MKILLLGDVHEGIEEAKKIIDSVDCDFVFQTGDFGTYCDFSKPTYFIAGNHENWKTINDIDAGRKKFKNLHHVKTAEIVTLVKNNEAITLSGINGNYSPKRYGMKIKDRERHFSEDDVEKCKKLKGTNIFLSHEAPLGIGLVKRNKDVGITPVREILDNIKPGLFVFCHHHVFFEKMIEKTKVLGLGRATKEYCVLDTSKNEIERTLLNNSKNSQIVNRRAILNINEFSYNTGGCGEKL